MPKKWIYNTGSRFRKSDASALEMEQVRDMLLELGSTGRARVKERIGVLPPPSYRNPPLRSEYSTYYVA